MHEVDDGKYLQFLDHERDNLIGPAPVEFSRLGLDLIPWDAPPHRVEAELCREAQVFAPVLVVAHQLILIQGAMAGADLRHKRIFDSGSPKEIFGAAVEYLLRYQN